MVSTVLEPLTNRLLSHQKELRLMRPAVLSLEKCLSSPSSKDRFSTPSRTTKTHLIAREAVSESAIAWFCLANHCVRTRTASKMTVMIR